MVDDPSARRLHTDLAAAIAERNDAMETLERSLSESAEERRLLMEEQDRFVSRLLAAHDAELRRLTAERDEERARAAHLCAEREADRAVISQARAAEQKARATIDLLRGDLELARSMLEDAMSTDELPRRDREAVRSSGRVLTTAQLTRDSGIRAPRERDSRRRSETPRAVNRAKGSRPPR